ncbi:MAG: IS30 family transposase [Candidatus Endonucleobacter bathymodioli]|uniref:IS30 family transposase n=1 Tax=Candidatus Endonucleibacter bathymodioli TaxID=539814 RepID=A0AA90P2E5_9GAMM|nr:IS30 family transposase [Candidatus Endonucleobacter bathymodioli]
MYTKGGGEIIGVSQPTVSREPARNTGDRGYRHKQAQAKAIQQRQTAVKPTKMTPPMIIVIEAKLRIEWSPEQVSGWLLDDQEKLISHETIYRHIWDDKQAGGDLYTHLRRRKKYDKRRNGKSTRGQIKNRVIIDERPSIVDDKSRIGDT